jgi:hypothetical protein
VFFNKNCERCVQVFLGELYPELTEEEGLDGWFQQNSATVHSAHTISMQALSNVLGDKIISSGIWPARSFDLNPCDFSFWGLKDRSYNSNPQTEADLKENIHKEIANIPAEHLEKVNQNIFNWCEECLHVEEQSFQHLL